MYKSLFFLLICVIGCGRNENIPFSDSAPILPELEAKVELYQSLLPEHQDENGFILTDTCDSLLFSGLLSAVVPVDIMVARDSEGRWHRRPDMDCSKANGTSRSTISKDMIVGLLYYFWYNKDLANATRFMEDLRNNNYVLRGEGTLGELLVPGHTIRTLAEIIKKLGGRKYLVELNIPLGFSSSGSYIAHLNVWHILLRGEVNGYINNDEFAILRQHAERQPHNPLFSAAYHKYLDHNYTDSVNLLLNGQFYPNDRLPTSADHCDEWPIQRDYSEKDYLPCKQDSPVEHSGAELILIYRLVIAK